MTDVVAAAEIRQRARAAYLGLALGDALGATVEFMTPHEIRAAYGIHKQIIGGGWLKLAPGAVTDDTQMSLALGQALIDAQGFDCKTVADAFLAWMRSGPPDIGNACRRGLQRYLVHGTLETPLDEATGGNGAAMRCLPVALYALGFPEECERMALAQARITHHQKYSDAATLTLVRMVQCLLNGGTLASARAIADALVANHPAFRFVPYPRRASGYIVDTMQTVFDALFSTQSFEACLIRAVNQGDDADTTGAIVGMLAGAYYGEAALPGHWLQRLDATAYHAIEQQVDAILALNEALKRQRASSLRN